MIKLSERQLERLVKAMEGIHAELTALREQQAAQYADPKVILAGFVVKHGSQIMGANGMPLPEVKVQ